MSRGEPCEKKRWSSFVLVVHRVSPCDPSPSFVLHLLQRAYAIRIAALTIDHRALLKSSPTQPLFSRTQDSSSHISRIPNQGICLNITTVMQILPLRAVAK